MRCFSKGSEWRKWDLHVHVPCTKLSNCYDKFKGEIDWNRFCKVIYDSDVSAIGMTDYFSFDGFFEFKKHYYSMYPECDKVFFPNLELRLNESVNKSVETIDYHILFQPDISYEISNKFLSHLKTQISMVGNRRLYCSELKTTSDFETATVTRSDIETALTDTFGDKVYWGNYVILIVPANNNGIRANDKSRRKMNIADEIDKFSNAVFGNPSNIDYFLSKDRFEDKDQESQPKPVFSGCDAHDFGNLQSWLGKQVLNESYSKFITWIKADLTFEGLQQVLLQPDERVYIGEIPPSLDRLSKNKQNYIASISVKRINNPRNKAETWFDFNLPLNNGLVSIIGNKGSGKSALTDIIGHFANCKTMKSASFLNPDRFRKGNKNYALDYEGNLTWYDGHIDEKINLQSSFESKVLENAQFLPQRYIEDICNDLDSGFRDEINRVIFSYVDVTERGNTSNLEQLIQQKSVAIEEAINIKLNDLEEINSNIIKLEDKLSSSYKKDQEDGWKKCKEKLNRHIVSKPKEVKNEHQNNDPEYLNNLKAINHRIDEINNQITEKNMQLTNINIAIDELTVTQSRVSNCRVEVDKINLELMEVSEKYKISELMIEANFDNLLKTIKNHITRIMTEKNELIRILDSSENADLAVSLNKKLEAAKLKKTTLISASNEKEKAYQKYIDDIKSWEDQKAKIIGSKSEPDTLEFYKHELDYVNNNLLSEYEKQCNGRMETMQAIFNLKVQIAHIYSLIYSPVEEQLNQLIGEMDDKVEFVSELSLDNINIGEELLEFINKSFSGIFNGKTASSKMTTLIKETDYNNWDSIKSFVLNVLKTIHEDIDCVPRKIKDRKGFYKNLCELKYVNAQYNLKVSGRNLDELSPGEKGIVLLIFYLALSKDERPLIIDQPEDNLDNQSVYCKLVKCIKEAKKKRQVIIVTHNPNIAVACDSEQLVYCSINKANNSISYSSGSIENPKVRKHVIDVLEGTMPAFDLRRRKYQVKQ